jgi:hypothetical protein
VHHRLPAPLLAGVLALALFAGGCHAFGVDADEFPDAGPGGPDSLLAGVGRGVPFGLFGMRVYGLPFTGAHRLVNRSSIAGEMRAAQAAHTRLVLNLAASSSRYRNPDGTFNMALWKARVDAYRDIDFAPDVTQGLILAHYLVDEPNAAGSWGGRGISPTEVEEMARYSKSIWPSLPTVVRAPPGWLRRAGLTWQYLDIAWAQWAGAYSESEGKTPEVFRDENVAQAKAQGLGLIMGMNLLNGGDGSSGEPGNRSERWEMSAAEVVRVGTVLAQTPYACAVLSWRYDVAFAQRSGIRAALDSVAAAAADRAGISCVQGGQ